MPIRPEDAAVALRLSAGEDRPLWLCFEPWANEYTLEPGMNAVICFPTTEIEMTHVEGGIVFFTMGVHPDVWGANGEELLIWSDDMPPTPDTPNAEAITRLAMAAVPPRPPKQVSQRGMQGD
ncbi:hypothetical protein ACFHW2_28470 [Actinomadura sp. LOL_016]|uniref:hypothetical protein n=1 Tax=unclassified Actinomadura TaxID=2626254 RepID=UPI003A8030A3